MLDDECNNIVQINLYANINEKLKNKQLEYQWGQLMT